MVQLLINCVLFGILFDAVDVVEVLHPVSTNFTLIQSRPNGLIENEMKGLIESKHKALIQSAGTTTDVSINRRETLPCGAASTSVFCRRGHGGDPYFCGYVNNVGGNCPYPCSKKTKGMSQWAGATSVSFLNYKDQRHDMLTIPLTPIEVINDMCGSYSEKATALSHLLYDGRKHAGERLNMKSNFAQCYHLKGYMSVYWLHQHTFNDAIPAEGFGCLPGFRGCPLHTRSYSCVASNDPNFKDTYAMAEKILNNIGNNIF